MLGQIHQSFKAIFHYRSPFPVGSQTQGKTQRSCPKRPDHNQPQQNAPTFLKTFQGTLRVRELDVKEVVTV